MDKEKFCLYCAQWHQLDDDRAVGKCSAHGGYRFQYESCLHWTYGGVRIPYREKEPDKKERNRSCDDEIERLIVSGNTMEDARLTLHCSKDLIRAVVKERGLKVSRRKVNPKGHAISGDAYEQTVHYYKNEKKSQRWISKKLGYPLSSVRGALMRAGLAR